MWIPRSGVYSDDLHVSRCDSACVETFLLLNCTIWILAGPPDCMLLQVAAATEVQCNAFQLALKRLAVSKTDTCVFHTVACCCVGR